MNTKYIFVTGGVVSAPSSVTNTSPCSYGLIVPGSTFKYGSNFCIVTLYPLFFNSLPNEAAVIPFPKPETDLDLGHYERFIDEN